MADGDHINALLDGEKKEQFSRNQETTEKKKKPRVRRSKEEKITEIDDQIAIHRNIISQLEAQKQRLLLSQEDKEKIENHCKFIIGWSVVKLLKSGLEKCTPENIKIDSYDYLNKKDKKNRLYAYFIEEMDKIFKK